MWVIYGSYEIECVSKCMYDYICTYHVIIGGTDPYCTGGWGKTGYITHYILLEEGTRIARAECEDGASNIYMYDDVVWVG